MLSHPPGRLGSLGLARGLAACDGDQLIGSALLKARAEIPQEGREVRTGLLARFDQVQTGGELMIISFIPVLLGEIDPDNDLRAESFERVAHDTPAASIRAASCSATAVLIFFSSSSSASVIVLPALIFAHSEACFFYQPI
jgi:hypothetical protein